jgi:hypothetical protein
VATSARLDHASLAAAREQDRPIRYLQSSSTDGALARRLLAESPVERGLICCIRCLQQSVA